MKTFFQLGFLVGLLLACSTLNAQVDSLRYSFQVKNDSVEVVIVNDQDSSFIFAFVIVQDEHHFLAEGEAFIDALDSVILTAAIDTSLLELFALELYETNERSMQMLPENAISPVQVVPNPATDHLSIQFGSLEGVHGLVVLTDIGGRIVYQQEQVLPNFLYLDSPIRPLGPGVYFLTVLTRHGRESVKIQKW